MRLLSLISVSCIALAFGGTTWGYLIDPESCSGDKYKFVKETVEQAFKMANLAVDSVQKTPIDPDASELIQQLFNVQGNNAAKVLVEDAFKPGILNTVSGEKPGILVFEEEKSGSLDDLGINEVVIFCNTTRLERRSKDPLHFYDHKAKQATQATIDYCLRALMWTQRYENKWSAIQICPWFLDYAMAKKYQTKVSIFNLRPFMAVKGLDRFITNKLYKPIDLMGLWDKVMLHEMMHTRPGGSKVDVGGTKGYGWKHCTELSTTNSAESNADSFALFASALYWAKQGSKIDKDGRFVSNPPTKGTSKRWFGSWAGRGLEVVKLNEQANSSEERISV